MVDYRQLRAADPARLEGAGSKAASISRDLDSFAEDVRAQRRKLPGLWQGQDAAEAQTAFAGHQRDYEQATSAYEAVGNALTELAAGVVHAKKLLDQAHEMAASVPAVIRSDGSVVADPPPEARKSDGWMASIAKGTEAVAAKIAEALKVANEADSRAKEKLASVGMPDAPSLSDADLARKLPGADVDTPAEVNAWWKSLTPAEREALKNEYPERIGDLDGVPAKDRDDANRLKLDDRRQAIDDRVRQIDGELANNRPGLDEDALAEERRELLGERAVLDKLENRLDEVDARGGEKTFLLKIDPTGDGKAIVAVGDPDKADNIVTYVPGTTTDLGNIGDDGSDIDRTAIMQTDAAALDPGKKTSSILWLGYDAPDDLAAANQPGHFRSGAEDLANFQTGLRDTHDGGRSNNTLLGHSYGGSTVGHTADRYDTKIDNLVHVASPGGGQGLGGDAGDYRGGPKVWATNAGGDWVGDLPVHGTTPETSRFGSRVFDSGDGGHSDYWSTQVSRDNIARIITGRHDEVTAPGDTT
ncbi:alpha/beta hydrolase [Phytomonospora sp. NPDC050363]|uniref:alpha/beta hydrolase n=1 Tax=Phytomonospora sp. NPDC050363 TaxID=3155642 RepID=UPI0033C73A13